MDTKNLSSKEVEKLIDSIKFPKKLFGMQEIWNKITKLEVNPIKSSTEIIDEDNDILYILHIQRGRIGDRYSIHLRFKDSNIHLARVDINPPKHENPDGTILERGQHHIHIYSSLYKKRDSMAYALSIEEFPNISNIVDVVSSFINKLKIKERTG
ncbi:DUF6978 family protein [Lactococcus petauri]|uniref:Uncharacterized protein n=1 Tax=Lactococcus petauri TaxID=1940789 RepID=A0ABZ2SG72_9LACT|nr:hypothetical protein [Lactococcus petauri]OAL09710.1 hypothetical protein A7X72_00743 [Lactococcus garvieae]MCV5951955.1 hypothetical protein [Lactococcus petauri]MCV5966496.1 hypothetical protein [Lactococcus petauri]MCV5969450.1 hypothetical protein [Lactococcus petauri]MCV5979810.1 hypothetical protein [Lactococcus petauri]